MDAIVKIIKPGYFIWMGKNKLNASSNIILIKDSGKNILVDTGSFGEEKKIISALKKEGLATGDIDIVINTHLHADHLGNNYLFSKAFFIDSLGEFKKGLFSIIATKHKIGENIKIIRTPGHTSEDVSVIVNTAKGKVAVIGDVFWRANDKKLLIVENKKKLAASRRKILKIADWIIPGHGKMFRNQRKNK